MAGKRSAAYDAPIRVVMISLDSHLAGAVDRARVSLRKDLPGLDLSLHVAADWSRDPNALERCKAAIATADVVVATMLFMEDQIKAILPSLEARREHCDVMVGCLSAAEIVKLTRLGRFRMDKPQSGPIALLKRLRGSKDKANAGAHQLKMLRNLPKLLKFIPGTAQDVRAYFLTLQYVLAGSEGNIANLVKYLLDRYAAGPRECLRGALAPAAPVEYPDVGVYHPRMSPVIAETAAKLPLARSKKPTVGVLIMRSYVLSGDTGHYDGAIEALEARGLRVIPAFASGLDARPAIEKFFIRDGAPVIDAMVSLTGFSLVGGPAYNDSAAAAKILGKLDIPYLSAHALEFQTLEDWRRSDSGLSPVEATIMIAIPELDGAIEPTVFGGRSGGAGGHCEGCERRCRVHGEGPAMIACAERVEALAARVDKLVKLRRAKDAERKLAIVLFNFPPNGGGVGTAAGLAVYESLHNTLKALAAAGYKVDVPDSVAALRARLLEGNASRFGADANVHARIPANEHVRRETRLADIERQWGPAPGRQQTDGRTIHILGAEFGNVFVGVQPAFGYEGDPMRLLFENSFAPTHAFAAFYRYLREDFGADAVLHFGTHGALEFMPGKQTGLTGECWSDYLIGDVPNYYFYAANNPSEAAMAKRRSAATTVSYLSPAITNAGLYKDLSKLKSALDRWRGTPPGDGKERRALGEFIQAEAAALNLAAAEPQWGDDVEREIGRLRDKLAEIEETLIPHGLHVAGEAPGAEERIDTLAAMSYGHEDGGSAEPLPRAALADIVNGAAVAEAARAHRLTDRLHDLEAASHVNQQLQADNELPALIHALDGGFIAPVAGGDLIHNADILPTGRNIHGFDPYRLPSAFAVAEGRRCADLLLARHMADGAPLPETVAIVLWGTDNLKSEGAQIAQALALFGAKPRFDGYGRLCGAELIPLEDLARPRIDVVATLSGIFRDLLPLQTRMLAEAALAAAAADEPAEMNFVRKHALAYQARHGCDLETAALRVFSNADGAYGANVNQLVDAGCWNDEDELADAYTKRKCFAYGASGAPTAQPELLGEIFGHVDLAYQNLESVELGVTTIDHYFDTLGGIGRAVSRARGEDAPVYIGDQTRGDGVVRTLSEQVALESRTRTLNPKWYEGMLKHGYEGVRQIEAQITNTMGWSATTGQVAPWVYQRLTETFILDTELRERLCALNPKSCAKVANRLLEACDRQYWTPDPETLEALQRAGEDIEDRIEGIGAPTGAAA